MAVVAGLDVGGAHLKVALVEDGRVVAVEQLSCPLWQGMDKLDDALAEARPLLRRAGHHGVTMTGELSDHFRDRKAGVEALVARLAAEFGPEVRFWRGRHGFGSPAEALRSHADVASTNFLATAEVVGRKIGEALLIDLGSTTTDIIPISGGAPVPRGLTDRERLRTGELVYTGLTRTSVMGITTRAPLAGQWQTLCREHFATMADVRRILGELADDVDHHATADGRGKSRDESLARFARLFGCDAADADPDAWREAARFTADTQLSSILEGCSQVISRNPELHEAKVVAAGIGSDVAAALAGRLGLSCVTFGELVNATGNCRRAATRSAPAAAVALLVGEQPGIQIFLGAH